MHDEDLGWQLVPVDEARQELYVADVASGFNANRGLAAGAVISDDYGRVALSGPAQI